MPSDNLLRIGKITGVHGIRGAVKMAFYGEAPQAVFVPDRCLLIGRSAPDARPVVVEWAKPFKNGFLAGFRGITDREAAEALAGADIFMRRDALPALEEEDTYYWIDLIGLSVVDVVAGPLGRIVSILPTGSNDVYVVRSERSAHREVLVPALASVVQKVDLAAGKMNISLPEELLPPALKKTNAPDRGNGFD